MPSYSFNNAVTNLSLDEVLVGASVQGTPNGSNFTLLNAVNGYTISFSSNANDFSYSSGNIPAGGKITDISVRNAGGTEVYSVSGLTGSLAAFWSTFAASGYQWAGSAAAFTNLFALTSANVITAGENSDRISLYGAAESFVGKGGNDTFIVNEGVSGTKIFGTLTTDRGTHDAVETDVVEIHGSARLGELDAIDLIRFADTPTAKTLTFSASTAFGAKAIQGSAASADTIHFTSGSDKADLDISKVQFTNWGRANQTVLVTMNTDTSEARDDRFVGSAVSEKVTTGNGRDLLYGNGGDDFLDGGDGIDVLDGGDGNDTLIGGGGEGPNILMGGLGNDVYKFNDKVDIVIDKGGLDSRVVSKTATLSSKEIFEGLAVDESLSPSKSVSLTGNAKANILLGHAGKNTLNGLSGNDILKGEDGNDKINGDAGNDQIYGGLGKDTLSGDAGKDTFYFDTALSSSNVDKISKFSTKDDRIALEVDFFAGLVGSKLASSAFYIGTKAKDADDRIIYNKTSGALSYDADGSGSIAAVKFATLDKNLKLTASDFILI
ncbi:calcium-binding protein [Microvirga aerilata]|uniref:Calcium-binding protein n=1 Tax=Microvirga aerilata TaxID=670292 RepID=A0A937CXD8_9HYPH|nr:calcium-binding protein [Microvirga aerilata]MBL0405268.1 calcium-binding protein [Microvirga aerilata]